MLQLMLLSATITLLLQIGCMLRNSKTQTPAAYPLWTFTLQSGGMSTLLTDGNLVYVVQNSDDGHIYAMDGASGQKLWDKKLSIQGRRRFGGKLIESTEPLATGGLLYYMAADECVHAIEGRTGRELWHYGPLFSLLASTADTVFLLDQDRHLTLLDTQGRVQSQLPVQGSECTSLEFASNTVIMRCMGTSSLQAFHVKTGQMLWAADREPGDLLLNQEIVYGLKGDRIAGLDAVTGKELWTYAVYQIPDPRAGARPQLLVDNARTDRVLYILVFDMQEKQRFLRMLDGQTGALRITHKLPWTQEWLGQATIFDRVLYVNRYKDHSFLSGLNGRKDYALSAVDVANGQELWRSPWYAQWFAPPIAAQGRVYVAAWGEQNAPALLYAFRAGRLHG